MWSPSSVRTRLQALMHQRRARRDMAMLFGAVQPDPSERARQRRYPLPEKTCVIYFTPRAGSTWLGDTLARTRCLGTGSEVFNPNFMPKLAAHVQADSLPEYVEMVQRRFNKRGVFSCEITWHQVQAVFGTGAAFMTHFHAATPVWLIRRDIVAQAVSLAKMVQTKVAHTPHANAQDRAAAEQDFVYDPAMIRKWVMHIHSAEAATEAHFARFGLTPLRLDYETITRTGAGPVVAVIARHLQVDPEAIAPRAAPESPHAKLGTSLNTQYAERFRAEETAWLAPIDAARAPWLARLPDDLCAPTEPGKGPPHTG